MYFQSYIILFNFIQKSQVLYSLKVLPIGSNVQIISSILDYPSLVTIPLDALAFEMLSNIQSDNQRLAATEQPSDITQWWLFKTKLLVVHSGSFHVKSPRS